MTISWKSLSPLSDVPDKLFLTRQEDTIPITEQNINMAEILQEIAKKKTHTFLDEKGDFLFDIGKLEFPNDTTLAVKKPSLLFQED